MARDTTAALVVVGNEILSGKVADSNSTFLAQQLRELGVALRRIVVVPDEVEVIAATVRELAPTVDVLFTSGAVGPTHDDVTIAGIARALGRAVVRHPSIEDMLQQYVRGPLNEAHLKMAEVVEGTELECAELRFPTFRVENIYVLPGIPEIFREKVVALRDRFAGAPARKERNCAELHPDRWQPGAFRLRGWHSPVRAVLPAGRLAAPGDPHARGAQTGWCQLRPFRPRLSGLGCLPSSPPSARGH